MNDGYYSPQEIAKRDALSAKMAAWRKFQDWQAAMTMNGIFGEGYVEVPKIPAGYEAYAASWAHDQWRMRFNS